MRRESSCQLDADESAAEVDIRIDLLGGDGTTCARSRAISRTGVPVIGVNFGRVGFLASSAARSRAGSRASSPASTASRTCRRSTSRWDERRVAVNDLVIASAVVGRMIQLEWAVGGEGLGRLACDGVVCATPSGSTGYNLSSGGPVLVWARRDGDHLRRAALAQRAAARRAARRQLIVWNRTPDVPATALVDGHRVGDLAPGGRAVAASASSARCSRPCPK